MANIIDNNFFQQYYLELDKILKQFGIDLENVEYYPKEGTLNPVLLIKQPANLSRSSIKTIVEQVQALCIKEGFFYEMHINNVTMFSTVKNRFEKVSPVQLKTFAPTSQSAVPHEIKASQSTEEKSDRKTIFIRSLPDLPPELQDIIQDYAPVYNYNAEGIYESVDLDRDKQGNPALRMYLKPKPAAEEKVVSHVDEEEQKQFTPCVQTVSSKACEGYNEISLVGDLKTLTADDKVEYTTTQLFKSLCNRATTKDLKNTTVNSWYFQTDKDSQERLNQLLTAFQTPNQTKAINPPQPQLESTIEKLQQDGVFNCNLHNSILTIDLKKKDMSIENIIALTSYLSLVRHKIVKIELTDLPNDKILQIEFIKRLYVLLTIQKNIILSLKRMPEDFRAFAELYKFNDEKEQTGAPKQFKVEAEFHSRIKIENEEFDRVAPRKIKEQVTACFATVFSKQPKPAAKKQIKFSPGTKESDSPYNKPWLPKVNSERAPSKAKRKLSLGTM